AKTIPGLVLLPAGSGKWLVLSLDASEARLWQPNQVKLDLYRGSRSGNKRSTKYGFTVAYSVPQEWQKIVKDHLSVPEAEGLRPEDFNVAGVGYTHVRGNRPEDEQEAYTRLRNIPDVKAAYEGASRLLTAVSSSFDTLAQAFGTRWSENIDRLLFTPEEEDSERNWEMAGSALRTAAGVIAVASAVAAPASLPAAAGLVGVAAATQLGGTMTDLAIAKTTDRGDTARRAWDSFYDNIVLDLLGAGTEAYGVRALKNARAIRAARPGGAAAHLQAQEIFQILSQWFDPDKIKKIPNKRVAATRLSDAAANSNEKVLDIINSGDGGSWVGVFNLEKAAGQLTEADDLARVSNFAGKSPDDVKWYLKGTGREITNMDDLRNAPSGYRVAFLNEDGEIIHAMRTVGNGVMEGKDSAGLVPSMSTAWSRQDMTDVLIFANSHFEANGRKIKLYVETDVPEFRIETRRSATVSTALNTEETVFRDKTLAEVMNYDSGITGKTIGKLIENPAGKCEALMNPVASYMRNHGYTNIKFRGMGIWDNVDQRTYANHYVVVGGRDGKRWVFDLSAGQFGNKGMRGLDGPIVDLEENWAKMYADSTTRKLIKYQDFPTASGATGEFGSVTGLDPLEYMSDSKLLSSPAWYRTARGATRA
ncbi:hypothetical protein ACWC0D_32215, partial [Streptomyces sp. NPDC001719]